MIRRSDFYFVSFLMKYQHFFPKDILNTLSSFSQMTSVAVLLNNMKSKSHIDSCKGYECKGYKGVVWITFLTLIEQKKNVLSAVEYSCDHFTNFNFLSVAALPQTIIISNGQQSIIFKMKTNIEAIYFVVSLVNCLKSPLFCIVVYIFVSDRGIG